LGESSHGYRTRVVGRPQERRPERLPRLDGRERPFSIAGSEPRHLKDCKANATIEFERGGAVIRLDTDFGLAKGSTIPLARKQACITVTRKGDRDEKNGTTII